MSTKKRVNPVSILLEIIIDLVLMGIGAALYIHFWVYPFGPIGLSPVVINLFGSLKTAVYVIAGLPFAIGLLSLIRTLARAVTPRCSVPEDKQKKQQLPV